MKQLLEINMNDSVKWCIDNNIEYNEEIFETIQSKHKKYNIIETYFPPKTGLDYSKIRANEESYYSISSYKDAEITTNIIISYFNIY